MDYTNVQELLDSCPRLDQDRQHSFDVWQNYLKCRKEVYEKLAGENSRHNLISEINWVLRSSSMSSEQLNVSVMPGDICYMDFGQAYRYEIGYQHFGLIVSMHSCKALVVPMTSNPVQYASAYDPVDNPHGRTHLMRLGRIGAMNRDSVMFLNDMKFVNTSRVIDVKAHLDTDSKLFHDLRLRLVDMVIPPEEMSLPC
ncbi:MAG: hypothetical protein LKF50_07510 [Solobacterium sp.]|jgi:hypothetical protein|nr:hypothetical protein [Solobacterium sp.]MCH4222904.1 hypothetical protein [Solobacterium sp.]